MAQLDQQVAQRPRSGRLRIRGAENDLLVILGNGQHVAVQPESSGTGSLVWSADPQHEFAAAAGAAAAYRSSKSALNAVTLFYSQELAGHGFKVNALAPGARATGLNERGRYRRGSGRGRDRRRRSGPTGRRRTHRPFPLLGRQ